MSTKLITKSTLAERFGESPKQIQRYVSEGMPCTGTGKTLRFAWAECRGWRDERIRRLERERVERDKPSDIEASRARKLEAEAREAEIRVERMLGTVVPLAVVQDVVGKVCDRLLPVLQNVPSNYGFRLEALGITPAAAEIVLEAIATELTKALQSTASDHEAEASADEVDEDSTHDESNAA